MGHYGQFLNKNWCHVWIRQKLGPAGFLLKKFTRTQHNYHTHEHKTLVALEALMKWEDKLLGRKFTVITDHKGLEYFKMQLNLFLRQTRWWEYLSCFNYNAIHVDDTSNQVVDNLLYSYEYNTTEDEYPNIRSRQRLSTHSAIHRNMKQCVQKIAKTTGKNSCSKTRKSDVK